MKKSAATFRNFLLYFIWICMLIKKLNLQFRMDTLSGIIHRCEKIKGGTFFNVNSLQKNIGKVNRTHKKENQTIQKEFYWKGSFKHNCAEDRSIYVTGSWQKNPVFSKGYGNHWERCRICVVYACCVRGCQWAAEVPCSIPFVAPIAALESLLVTCDVLPSISRECTIRDQFDFDLGTLRANRFAENPQFQQPLLDEV